MAKLTFQGVDEDRLQVGPRATSLESLCSCAFFLSENSSPRALQPAETHRKLLFLIQCQTLVLTKVWLQGDLTSLRREACRVTDLNLSVLSQRKHNRVSQWAPVGLLLPAMCDVSRAMLPLRSCGACAEPKNPGIPKIRKIRKKYKIPQTPTPGWLPRIRKKKRKIRKW